MKTKRIKVGELCNLVRGTAPTLKTMPGPYPLVVTADFRRSADNWQLEGPAVCIPLVSSTGHGHAAIHRVHYQEGRFALANLLVALIPKDPTVCIAKYLYYLFMARKDSLLVPLMLGTANVSLKVTDIAEIAILLPSFEEQQRVVSRIEKLGDLISEALSLRNQSAVETEIMCRSILMHDKLAELTPMRELVRLRPLDVTVLADETYQFAGVYSFGRGVFKAASKSGMEFAYTRLTRLKANNFVYPKLMAWEGALGIVPQECEGCVVSPEFPVFEVLEDKVYPEVLDTYFKNPTVWPSISGASSGTNVRRRRLNPQSFLNYSIPLPTRQTQEQLRKVRAQVDELKRLRAETDIEMEALLPAILYGAFNGEL